MVNGVGTKFADDSKWGSEVNTKVDFDNIYRQWIIKQQLHFQMINRGGQTVCRELSGKNR